MEPLILLFLQLVIEIVALHFDIIRVCICKVCQLLWTGRVS